MRRRKAGIARSNGRRGIHAFQSDDSSGAWQVACLILARNRFAIAILGDRLPSGGSRQRIGGRRHRPPGAGGTTSHGTDLHDPVPDARAVQARRTVPQGHARRRHPAGPKGRALGDGLRGPCTVFAGLLGETMLESYGVPLDILRLAGGIILFLVALKTVLEQFAPAETPSDEVALVIRRRHEGRDAAARLSRNRDALWHCGARRVSRLQPEHGDPADDRCGGRGRSWR